MSNAISQLKDDKSQITISAGNTGAMMAYSTVYLRTVENITRPAITSLFPSKKHPVCLLDLGANSECTSENLVDFAIPANDDSSASVAKILDVVCGSISEGLEERKATKEASKKTEKPAAEEETTEA